MENNGSFAIIIYKGFDESKIQFLLKIALVIFITNVFIFRG